MGSGHETLGRYLDVSLANFVAWAVGCGPLLVAVVVAGLRPSRRVDPDAWTFLPAVMLIAHSTLFTFEVERIWLFLTAGAAVLSAGALRDRLGGGWRLAMVTVVLATLALAMTLWLEARLYTWW